MVNGILEQSGWKDHIEATSTISALMLSSSDCRQASTSSDSSSACSSASERRPEASEPITPIERRTVMTGGGVGALLTY
jgi:hypothetical protein